MIKLDYAKNYSLEDLIQLSKKDNLVLKTLSGKEFIFGELQSEADFEREIEATVNSPDFIKLGEERSKEPQVYYTLEEVRKHLGIDEDENVLRRVVGEEKIINFSTEKKSLEELLQMAVASNLILQFSYEEEYLLADVEYYDFSNSLLNGGSVVWDYVEEVNRARVR
jgi:hypothetical protein